MDIASGRPTTLGKTYFVLSFLEDVNVIEKAIVY